MKLLPDVDQPAEHPSEAREEDASLELRWNRPDPEGGSRRDAMLCRLRQTCRKGAARRTLGALDLRGISLVDEDLSNMDLSGADLSGADLSRTRLDGTVLFRARLVGTSLFNARMDQAEFSAADLSGANMEGVVTRSCGFGMAKLRNVMLFQADLSNATLTEADLRGSDLRMARLQNVRARRTGFSDSDLSHADLREADLSDSDVARANFGGADLRGAELRRLRNFTAARWSGVDIRDIDFSGAYILRRHILDSNYLEEFRNKGRLEAFLYALWWLTSDCGRSLVRWGLWTMCLALFYAALYRFVAVDYGPHPTSLSPIYFSVVTLTTLGYGDVVPASTPAQLLAIVEVLTGYVMLGGLLSILSHKMARRAE